MTGQPPTNGEAAVTRPGRPSISAAGRRRFLATLGGLAATTALASTAEPTKAETDDPAESPVRLHRWAMVIDLGRCDGCTGLGLPPQCTQFCAWGRFVPEGQQWIEVYEYPVNDLPNAGRQFLVAPCMQCQNAPCVNVCPVAATFHTPEGVVLIDQERCIGCRLCMAACPYDRRFFNWGEPVQPEAVKASAYDIVTQVPAKRGTVMKCDFCTERADAGGLPFCVEACPRNAIYFGDLETDVATNVDEVVSFSTLINDHAARPYKEELGTKPRVYYIEGSGAEAPRSTYHEQAFLKERLEWPWPEIMAAAEKARVEVGAEAAQ